MQKDQSHEIKELFHRPLKQLLSDAQKIQRDHHKNELEFCALLSVKTGNCSEDCAYCPQSSRYKTCVEPHALLDKKTVLQTAQKAKEAKATNFCLATAGREVKEEKDFEALLEMIREISLLGLRVCTSLGFLNEERAKKLKEAGVFAYNHNIDTSPSFYKKIITTHSFEERLQTIAWIKKSGMKVCTGGILGMGETVEDRIDFIHYLTKIKPDSLPLNSLIVAKGTPLENMHPLPFLDFLRVICVLRILLPHTLLRIAGGRGRFSFAEQLLCFTAGIGGVHIGEKLLVLPNCSMKDDQHLFALLEEQLQ